MTSENPLTQKFIPEQGQPEISNFEAILELEKDDKASWTRLLIRDGLTCITLIALGVAIALEAD